MAPSKRISLAFLLAFAVVAATLPPSAAGRDVAAAAKPDEAESSTPPQQGGGGWPFPPLPPLPSFPCIPGWPRPRFLPPCNDTRGHGGFPFPRPLPPAPQPAECHTPLAAMATPCAGFLTKTDAAAAPPAACCDGYNAVVKDAPVCMCHVLHGGGFAKLLPAPMLRLRMMQLPRACGAALPFATLRQCFRGNVPPMDPPSSP